MHISNLTILFHLNHSPGMVAKVAEKMAAKGMSIEELTTELRINKAGEREFFIDALVSSPNLADSENLEGCIADISTLEDDLKLTRFDVRVHTH
jgi:glycine cleavage system regulatory protein